MVRFASDRRQAQAGCASLTKDAAPLPNDHSSRWFGDGRGYGGLTQAHHPKYWRLDSAIRNRTANSHVC
jgi:hypothetical protein